MHAPFPIAAPICQSTYNELTDSPNAIRRIVSPSNSATLSWRILLHPLADSDKGIVSVTTSSSSCDPSRFLIAGPDNTGCVQYATTLRAPLRFNAAAAAHNVPA